MDGLGGTGRDLVHGEEAAWLEDAMDLGVEALFVGDVHGAVLGPGYVEGVVGEGHVEGVACLEGDLGGEAGAGGEHLAGFAELFGEVEDGDVATEFGGE